VSKAGDKGSYLIAFKNGTWAYYRSSKIEAIDEEQYNAASENFVIDKSLPSPSPSPAPSSISMSPSPTPDPDVTAANDEMKANKNIKFTADQSTEVETRTSTAAHNATERTESTDTKMEIRIGDVDGNENKDEAESVDDVVIEHEVNEEKGVAEAVTAMAEEAIAKAPESNDIEVVESAETDALEDGIGNEEDKGGEPKSAVVTTDESVEIDDEAKSETLVSVKTEENNTSKRTGKARKATKKKAKEKPKEKAKEPKKPELSTIAKKLKKFYKVKDRREAAYLVMCDSRHDSLTLQSLYEYIAHFEKDAVSKKMVKGFFETMKPNASNGDVSFSNFVKAIDDTGDVVAAYERYKKSGTSRASKK